MITQPQPPIYVELDPGEGHTTASQHSAYSIVGTQDQEYRLATVTP